MRDHALGEKPLGGPFARARFANAARAPGHAGDDCGANCALKVKDGAVFRRREARGGGRRLRDVYWCSTDGASIRGSERSGADRRSALRNCEPALRSEMNCSDPSALVPLFPGPWSLLAVLLLTAAASAARPPSRSASRDVQGAAPSPQAAREEYRPLRLSGRRAGGSWTACARSDFRTAAPTGKSNGHDVRPVHDHHHGHVGYDDRDQHDHIDRAVVGLNDAAS